MAWWDLETLREKPTLLGKTVKRLTSLKTTAVLGATLGTLLFPATALGLVKGAGRALVPTTVKGAVKAAIIAPAAVGLIASSPKVRDILKRTLSPRAQYERGRTIGGIVEDPSKLLPKEKTGASVGERVRDIAKTTGLIGGGVAAAVGGAVLARGALQRARTLFPSATTQPMVSFQQLPSAAPAIQPFGAMEKPVKEPPLTPATMPSIKITNKPEININFRKSRKFINQQVMVRR